MSLRLTKYLAIFTAAALLAGCAAITGEEDTGAEGAAVIESAPSTEPTTTGMGTGTGYVGDPLDDPNSLLSTRVVYFDFDRSDVRPEDRKVLEAHARFLAEQPGAQVSLEGHADERGTREYNLALGERRANAVRSMMTLSGASGQQTRTVSYGEENPVDPSHNEAAWALNRRVEIIYLTR